MFSKTEPSDKFGVEKLKPIKIRNEWNYLEHKGICERCKKYITLIQNKQSDSVSKFLAYLSSPECFFNLEKHKNMHF